ncbi:putative F-box protein At1g47790 [Bidens hawaiensis]|uniref:putative F-box protein At1g47790 n=1 Tax=Bidens hawaiensis TaxID=980011 RepID=UPI00404A950F
MSDYICSDLLFEIFKKLPPKSIIRFRSLSKYWHSRLISPEFLHDHRLQSSKYPPKFLTKHLSSRDSCCNEFKYIYTLHSGDQLLIDPGHAYSRIPGVEFPYSRLTTEVVGSCNGILCLRNNKSVSLWNFSIRRRIIVSHWKSCVQEAIGFGFDPITDDYKIVSVSYNKHALGENNALLYSLKTDSWRAIPSPSTRFYNVMTQACLFNGILHWVVEGFLTEPSPEGPTRFILTFNLSSHVFGHIVLPKRWKIRQLITIHGRLAVVYWIGVGKWRIRVVGSWSMVLDFEGPAAEDVMMSVLQPITKSDFVAYYNEKVGPGRW